MNDVLITGTGLWTPEFGITNEELVESLSQAVEKWNTEHAAAIESGEIEQRDFPSVKFIQKASGVGHRYVIEKEGMLDPTRFRPHLPTRSEDELSIQAEICITAAKEALAQAGLTGSDLDAVVVGASNIQRAYPAVAIEVQEALGASGFAYDMNVACSSATFALQNAIDAIKAGNARRALVLCPELTSCHNNFELREFHFIFGDACTAVVVESADVAGEGESWEVLGTRLATKFSNNIRNDFGFMNVAEDTPRDRHELMFRQNGRQVFHDVCPMVAEHIASHVADAGVSIGDLKRFWLHQANLGMNKTIAKTLLGREPDTEEAPVILDEYANTSSAGSVIAFHKHRDGIEVGEHAVLCSFGAGYSVGSVVVRRRA